MTRRKGKEIPRLPLSAFGPPDPTSDTYPLQVPPTPSLLTPGGLVDAHLNTAHPAHTRAVVLSPRGHAAGAIVQSLQSGAVDAPVLAVLTPFALDSTEVLAHLSATVSPALTAVYDGATPVVVEAEEDSKDQAQAESSVKNLRWALQHGRVVDLDIQGGIIAIDPSVYDSLLNLLAKAIRSGTSTKRTPIVLTNALPPPLDSITPVVALMNHPAYNTYRQRVSSLSLFEDVYVKLLPPAWVSTELGERQELKNILILFIVPVLEAFGFERIIFGSSPAFADGSPALAESWYKLVLGAFRELAVSQDEMDKIFIDNAERVYGSTQ